MTIKNFLDNWKVVGENNLSSLKYEKERLNNEMLYQMKNSSRILNLKKIVDKLFDVWGFLLIITGFFGCFLGIFDLIPLNPFIYSILGIGAVSYAGYKIVETNLNKKCPYTFHELYNRRASMIRKLKDCQDKINELENIIGEVSKTDKFFQSLNQENALNDLLPTSENQIMFYLKENMSLLSILYLSKRKMLPGDAFNSITLEELQKVKYLGKKIDQQLKINPNYFVLDENNSNIGTIRRRRVQTFNNYEQDNSFEEEKHRSR